MKWILCILPLCIACAGVCAQPAAEQEESDEILIFAEFGFNGVVPSDRFGPVRIWVQAQQDDISGIVEFIATDENGSTERAVAPIDVAAGGSGSASIVVPISVWTETVDLVLRNNSGARLAEVRYASLTSPTTLELPAPTPAESELLIDVTQRCSAVEIAEDFVERSLHLQLDAKAFEDQSIDQQNAIRRRMEMFADCVGVDESPEKLPLSQMAYDGVVAVIVDSTTVQTADPRAVAALHRWVLGGGRLVILADMPGELWRRLLPPGVPSESIVLGVQQQVQIPADLARAAGEPDSRQILARPISVSLPALDAGWQQRWNSGEDSLLVEGPAGFGWVTIVSVHPGAAGLSEPWRAWAETLAVASEVVSTADNSARSLQVRNAGWYRQGFTKQIPIYVFDAIGISTPIGTAAIVLVAVVTISLAVALGPIDFVMLKLLRLRHLAWLSALVWIGIASVVGVVMPDRLRAGPSSVARLSVIDQLVVNEALSEGLPHAANEAIGALPPELRSWRLSFTNLFAGSRSEITLENAGEGVYWSEYVGLRAAAVLNRPLTTVQQPRSGGLDALRSSAPRSIRPGVWTSKVYTDAGPATSPVGVALRPTELGWRADVSGLGASSRVLAGQLRVGGRHFSVSQRETAGDGATLGINFSSRLATHDPLDRYAFDQAAAEENRYSYRRHYTRTLDSFSPPVVQTLHGPLERTPACERMLETGRFAMLELFVTDQPIEVDFEGGELETQQSTMYRLMIPIEGDQERD